MANSIRTPRPGVTANSNRIALAVDDEEWQKFRVSLKGISTADKLARLKRYYETHSVGGQFASEDVQIRCDNYLKALCRGGQLNPGESLQSALKSDWNLPIRK